MNLATIIAFVIGVNAGFLFGAFWVGRNLPPRPLDDDIDWENAG